MDFDLEVMHAAHEYRLRHNLPVQPIDPASPLYASLKVGGIYFQRARLERRDFEQESREEYRRQDWEARHCMDDGYEEERALDNRMRARDFR